MSRLRDSTRIGTILGYVRILHSLPVITRFAPSPTGSLHLGNARTAFFSPYGPAKRRPVLFCASRNTDAERSRQSLPNELMAECVGSAWTDEGPISAAVAPYSQAERVNSIERCFAQLEVSGEAYPCYCTAQELDCRQAAAHSGKPPRYADVPASDGGAARERESKAFGPALRFAVPERSESSSHDAVHGPQRYASSISATYHSDATTALRRSLCNAVDDSRSWESHRYCAATIISPTRPAPGCCCGRVGSAPSRLWPC